uniref:Protein kinase n=1 Tax=Trypanosoma congolense (strain IL3000) TaxID=1068625 RepID=G0UTB2_TRYCI|nr:putative protein kinase [Trypanosoma congolense IL3000]
MSEEHEPAIHGAQWQDWCTAVTCHNRLCCKKFSLLLGKHYCQWCGNIFCDRCAPFSATRNSQPVRRCNSCRFPSIFRSLCNPRTHKRDGNVSSLIVSFLDNRSITALMQSCHVALAEFNVGDYAYYESITDRFPTYFEGAMIGKGGFGTVYKCEDRCRPGGARVALKVITKSSVVTYKLWSKIVTELSVLQSVDHENVARLLEVLQTPRQLVIVMEAGEGGTLMQAWKLAQKYNYNMEVFVANVVLQVAEGLDYLYREKAIVHRDIKLENIVLTHDFKRVMIIDFGLAEYIIKGEDQQLFVPCGTAGYTSPENVRAVVERRRVFTASGWTMHLADMYSLGVVAYILLSGQLPLSTRCFASLFKNMCRGVRCNGPQWSSVSDGAKSLVESLLKTDWRERADANAVRTHPFVCVKVPLIAEIAERHIYELSEAERNEVKEWVFVEPSSGHWDLIDVDAIDDEEKRKHLKKKTSELHECVTDFSPKGFMRRLRSAVWE